MFERRRISPIGGAFIAIGIVAGLAVASPAAAQETPPPDEYSYIQGNSEAGLTPENATPANGGASTLGVKLGVSPAGCTGKTDWAHYSDGDASVHGRTTCTFRVPSLGVTTILQKLGWFYWESMKNDSSSRADATNSEDAHPHWDCLGWGSQAYRGVSTHWSQEASGRYSATTVGEEHRFSC